MISKSYSFLIFISLLLVTSVKVQEENDPPCKEPRPIACPSVICNMMNTRNTDFCKAVTCEGLSPEKCGDGSVYERSLTMCGCCAGCARYIDVGEPCEVNPEEPMLDPNCTHPSCPILMNQCKPGLVCNYLGGSSKVCAPERPTSPPEGEEGEDDDEDEGSNEPTCETKRNLGMVGELHYTPICLDDGTYAPKQCKGRQDEEGVCFCVGPDGERIFGREWRTKSQNQTCECSRHVHNLRSKNYNAALHCSPEGNYEPLQCDYDSKVCYCVDEKTGRLTGAVLPEDQWKLLPCYSYNLTNWDTTGEYLRKCESQWVAGQRLAKQAVMHGLLVMSVKDYICDYDGSFWPRHRLGALWYCVTKEGSLTGNFQEIEGSPMDCQCYRDSVLFAEEGRNFQKICGNSTGNYALTSPYVDSKDIYSCVDKDGFYFGDRVEARYHCCLLGDCSAAPDNIKNECYNPSTGTGRFHSCSYWQT